MTTQSIKRKKESKAWKIWFIKRNGREPTYEEGLAFGQGFNTGWKNHMNRSSKFLFEELGEILNNIEDDLGLDLKKGENGFKSYQDSYQAIKKYTLKVLKNKYKNAEHNYNLGHKSFVLDKQKGADGDSK